MEERSISQAMACTIFPAYILMIIVFTVFIRLPNNEYSAYLMPLWSYREILKTHNRELLFETIANILIFIPVGVLLPLCEYRKKNNNCFTIVLGLFLILFVEVFQFITRVGTFETDDIINNFIGMILGYSAIMVIKIICGRIKKGRDEK